MSNFIQIDGESDDAFYIEVIPVEGSSGIKKTSKSDALEKLTTERFGNAIRQAVIPACNTFVSLWQDVKQSNSLIANSAEVEFNLGLTASGNMAIVQTSGQASFKVKVSWKFKTPEQITLDQKAVNEQINQDIDLLKRDADDLEKIVMQMKALELSEDTEEKSFTSQHISLTNSIKKLQNL